MYQVILSKAAQKDRGLLKAAKLDIKAKELLNLIMKNPFDSPPPYEALVGKLKGCYSRRINYQHRLVYTVDDQSKIVHVLRMWTHYNNI